MAQAAAAAGVGALEAAVADGVGGQQGVPAVAPDQAPAGARGVIPQEPLLVAPVEIPLLAEPLTSAQIQAAIAAADSGLVYLWEQGKGLPLEVQARFSILGFTEMAVFSKLADTAGEVRTIVQDELGLRNDLGVRGRALVGRILTCWEAAQKRLARKHTEEADQRAVDLPRRLPEQEHDEMLNAYEDAHEEKEDVDTPAKPYTDGKITQIEKGKLVAERLSEVLSVAEATEEDWNGALTRATALSNSPKMLKVRCGFPRLQKNFVTAWNWCP